MSAAERQDNGTLRASAGEPIGRRHILVCAYACRPAGSMDFGGGEDLLGWNVVQQLSRFCDLTVLTHADNQPAILSADLPAPGRVRFEFIALPWPLRLLEHFPGGIQFSAYLWQWAAWFVARQRHARTHFDAFHHVTYANDWMASVIGAWLPVPYLRGPGGGAHRVPRAFLREYTWRGRLSEWVRSVGQWVYRQDPLFRAGQARAVALFVCNREAYEGIPPRWRQKALLFPVNGIAQADLESFNAMPPAPRGSTFRVISAGKLIRLKGFSLAVKAFARFAGRCPGVELLIVGDGPDRRHLQRLIRMLRLESQVHLVPWMRRDDVLRMMRSCDVFLFSSLRDGGGAVVIEAMGAGKPVICFDLGGPGLHVTDACGVKLAARNPERAVDDFAEALERLYREADLRARMGLAARARAEQEYHWDRLGERLLAAYRTVWGEAPSPAATCEHHALAETHS